MDGQPVVFLPTLLIRYWPLAGRDPAGGGGGGGWHRRGAARRHKVPGLQASPCVSSHQGDCAGAACVCGEVLAAAVAAIQDTDVVAASCCRGEGPSLATRSVILHNR